MNTLKIILKIILIGLALLTLWFQSIQTFWGIFNRNLGESSFNLYADIIPLIFTLVIIIWFIIHQLKSFRK